jgi:hypothetical protein
MEEVHIRGMVEGTRADSTGVCIVSQWKIQCPNQWVPVLDLFSRFLFKLSYSWMLGTQA